MHKTKMSSTSSSLGSHCVGNFTFLRDTLLPNFLISKSGESNSEDMTTLGGRISQYAVNNPTKFVALSTFIVLGGIPIIGFLAYAVATIIASLIGAIVLELVLLGIGITGLAFVLFFVICITLCATSIFAALYYSYQVAYKTWSRRFSAQPHTNLNHDSQQNDTEPSEEQLDKTK